MHTNKATAGDTGTFNTPHGTGSLFGQVAIGGIEMPYTGPDDPKLPENVQALPETRRAQWAAVFNSAFEKCTKDGGEDCESSAFAQANGVVFDRKDKQISLDQLQRDVSQAFYSKFRREQLEVPMRQDMLWVVEVYTDHIIVEKNETYFSVPMTVADGGEYEFADESQWTEVREVHGWAEKAAAMKADAATNALPDSAFLYVEPGGDKDDEGKTVPRSLRHLPYKNAEGGVDLPRLRNALSRLGQPATGETAGERWLTSDLRDRLIARAQRILEDETNKSAESDRLYVYKQGDGTYRWAAISSTAIKDKEFEIVSEGAYDDAIQHARESGEFGEIDLVHVDGTDVGKCDLMMRIGKQLVEGGVFDDTEMARGVIKAIEEDPGYWGISIKFVYDPSKFDGEKYHGNIRITKRTILPQEMAASYGTKLVAIGGQEMKGDLSQKARDALARLNVPEDQIEALAEKQVDQPENVVEKETETEPAQEETVEVKKSLWEQIKGIFAKPDDAEATEPDADTGGVEVEEVIEPEKAQESDMDEIVKGIFDTYTEAIVETVAGGLAQRDEQIEALGNAVLALGEQVKALSAPIEDQVAKRLAELPPIVKAAPSQVAVIDKPAAGRVLPAQQVSDSGYVNKLVGDIRDAIERNLTEQKVQV